MANGSRGETSDALRLYWHPWSVGRSVERKPVGWRAREWRRMLDEGVYRTQSDLARGERVTTAAVSIALRKLRER